MHPNREDNNEVKTWLKEVQYIMQTTSQLQVEEWGDNGLEEIPGLSLDDRVN